MEIVMTDANETFETPKMEVPTVARDLAQRAVKTARERADNFNATAEKATASLESALATSTTTVADVARAFQGAIHADVTATLATVEKIAAAKSLAEAAQIHVEFLGERGQISLARMRSATEYFAKAMAKNAERAQETLAKFTPDAAKAA
jgi:hypothetical protein